MCGFNPRRPLNLFLRLFHAFSMGALTSKPFAFRARRWELNDRYTYDLTDAYFSPIRVSLRGPSVMRVLPDVREGSISEWISDRARFSYDSSSNLDQFKFDKSLIPGQPSNFYFSNYWLNFYSKRVNFSPFLSCDVYASIKNKSSITFRGLTSPAFFNFDFRPALPVSLYEPAPTSIFLAGINVRYDIPVFAISLRKAFLSGAANFFNIGFFTNNLLGETNFGSSVSSLFSLIRSKSRLSRLTLGDSVFYTNPRLYSILKLHFKKVYCAFSSSPSLASSEINFFSPAPSRPNFYFHTPHFYYHESLQIRNGVFTTFPSILSSVSRRHPLLFFNGKLPAALTRNFFTYLNNNVGAFHYSNYYTYYTFNLYSSRSINNLLSLTRQTAERSTFTYNI
jgi:hypothetical protein